jgi:hypothetical protein
MEDEKVILPSVVSLRLHGANQLSVSKLVKTNERIAGLLRQNVDHLAQQIKQIKPLNFILCLAVLKNDFLFQITS